jgi:hypothetical protein
MAQILTMKLFKFQKFKAFSKFSFVYLILVLFTIELNQAQTSNFFYSFISGDFTFNKRNDDGTNPVTVYTPATNQINESAADGSLSKLYFYETGSNIIYQSDYNGGNKTTAFTTSTSITSLAAGNGYIFYAYSNSPYSVRRCSSTGSGDMQLYLNPSQGTVNCIAFDATNNYLYYYEAAYDGTNNRIFRTNANGDGMQVIYNNCPSVLSLAAGGGYVYYAINSGTYALYRRTSTGGSETAIYTPTTGDVNACTYDGILNKIYFCDPIVNGSSVIYKADADGSNRTSVYSGFTYTLSSLSSPTAVPIVSPLVTTQAASSISSTGATLNGSVTANGANTVVTFQYGTTTDYGITVTATQSPVTGTSATAVSCSISGLTPNTTYHFRVVGVNFAGTTNGTDVTFTTNTTTGIQNIPSEDVRIYPNPASHMVYIKGAKGTVTIYSTDGQLIGSKQIAEDGSISVSSLTKGIYIIKINGKEYKLIKE